RPARLPGSSLFPYTTLFRSRVGRERCSLANAAQAADTAQPAGGANPRTRRPRRTALQVSGFASQGRTDRSTYLPDSKRTGQSRSDRKSTRLNSSHVKISYAV